MSKNTFGSSNNDTIFIENERKLGSKVDLV